MFTILPEAVGLLLCFWTWDWQVSFLDFQQRSSGKNYTTMKKNSICSYHRRSWSHNRHSIRVMPRWGIMRRRIRNTATIILNHWWCFTFHWIWIFWTDIFILRFIIRLVCFLFMISKIKFRNCKKKIPSYPLDVAVGMFVSSDFALSDENFSRFSSPSESSS